MKYLSDSCKRIIERRLALLGNTSSGVPVYAVYADYRSTCQNKYPYYVLACSRKEAKARFNSKFSWLKIFKCEPVDYNKAVQVVQDIEHNCIMS